MMDKKDILENKIENISAQKVDNKEGLVNEDGLLDENNNYHPTEILARLENIQRQIADGGLNENIETSLKELYEKEKSFFIKKKIKRMLTLPLDDLDEDSKRIFIKLHWDGICEEIGRNKVIDNKTGDRLEQEKMEKLDPLNNGDVSDSYIERLFAFFRNIRPYNYTIFENKRFKFFYENKYIIDNYKMPKTEITSTHPFYYSRMSDKYCALYESEEGNLLKFFKLDDKIEQSIGNKKAKEGELRIKELEHEIIEIEDALMDKNGDYLSRYVYLRRSLPQSLMFDLDKKLEISNLPEELDKKFFDEDEFSILLEKNRRKIGIPKNIQKLETLKNSLIELLDRKCKTCAKENQGFRMDNINRLRNIAAGYLYVTDNAYYRIEDYMMDRRFLPSDLLEKFENNFSINFEQYATDKFPYFNDSIIREIKRLKAPIKKPFQWLSREIMLRIDSVNNSRPELKEVSLEDILAEESFDKNNLVVDKYEEIFANYRALMELETRRNIDVEFGIKLSDFSVREQVQFVNFLSSKTENEVEKVKDFLNQGINKKDRLKAFLSLETDEKMGEVILSLGEKLKDQPELADQVFGEYAEMMDSLKEDLAIFVQEYEKIFIDKQVDQKKVQKHLLKEAVYLLRKADQVLSFNDNKESREDSIASLLEKIRTERKMRKKSFQSLVDLVELIDKEVNELSDDFEYNELVEVLGDPEKYSSPRELNEAINRGEITYWWKKDFSIQDRIKRFDSETIKKIIDGIRKSITSLELDYSDYFEIEEDQSEEIDVLDLKIFSQVKKQIEEKNKKIQWFENLLKIKTNLEVQAEELVFGQDADLQEKFKNHISQRVLDKYQHLVDGAKKTKKELEVFYKKRHAIEQQEAERMVDSVFEKAKKLLFESFSKIVKKQNLDEEEIIRELESYDGDLIFRVLAIRETLKAKGSLEEVAGVGLRTLTADKLVQKEDLKKEFLAIAKANWEKEPLNKLAMGSLNSAIEEASPNTTFYFFEFETENGKKKVGGFGRADRKGKVVHLGSLNILPSLQKTAVGWALRESIMRQESGEGIIFEIESDPNNLQTTPYYIGKEGFIGQGVISIKDFIKKVEAVELFGKNDFVFQLYSTPKNFESFFKSKSEAEIVKIYIEKYAGREPEFKEERFIFKELSGSQKANELSKKFFEQGFVLTSYFFADKDKKEAYHCFEKKQEK